MVSECSEPTNCRAKAFDEAKGEAADQDAGNAAESSSTQITKDLPRNEELIKGRDREDHAEQGAGCPAIARRCRT